MLGWSTTLFILAMLLVGGLGDYLKNIFMLTQEHILVMAIGSVISAMAYVSHWHAVAVYRSLATFDASVQSAVHN